MIKLKYIIVFCVIIFFLTLGFLHHRVIEMNEYEFGSFLEEKTSIKDLIKLKEETKSYYLLSYKPASFNIFFFLGLDLNYSNIKIQKKELKINLIKPLYIGEIVFSAGCQNRFIFSNYQYKKTPLNDNKTKCI